jgi:hypothetical protein
MAKPHPDLTYYPGVKSGTWAATWPSPGVIFSSPGQYQGRPGASPGVSYLPAGLVNTTPGRPGLYLARDPASLAGSKVE